MTRSSVPDTQALPQEQPLSHTTLLLSGLQHLAIIAPIGLVFPLLVLRAADAGAVLQEAMITASLLALGIGSIVLCLRRRALGSGFLCPAVFTAAYLPASLAAAQNGGLALVFGMTMFAGACEIAFSFLLRRLRAYLPVEIAGLAVVMIGLILGLIGFRLLLGLDSHGEFQAGDLEPGALEVGLFALALVVGLNVWGKGRLRIFSVLICVALAYPLAWGLGQVDLSDFQAAQPQHLLALPHLPLLLPAFDWTLAIPFAAGALACALRATGDITTCQKIAEADWVRPEMGSIERGVRADGLGTLLAGALGTVGMNTFSSSIGLSQATGIIQRRVGFAIGGLFIALAFSPFVVMLTIGMPEPLTGAILIFSSAFILANGLSIIVARLLDARRILTIGIAIVFGISHDVFPPFYDHVPLWLKSITGSALVVALVTALALNALFRIGVRQSASLDRPLNKELLPALVDFCREKGALWGARRDVMERVISGLTEAVELALGRGVSDSPVRVHLHYDEFRILATVSFEDAPEQAPVHSEEETEEAPDTSELEFRLMRHFAEKVALSHQQGYTRLKLLFDS
ncbi:uracil-xanthine permease family protein [Fodinicurvata halophila]|uniref:Uracil-xanthine permease family protein n=1 Tax=Fodinicurvata halophila TaxID=1419723 RepID=A0ABV8UN94_9PROT